MDKELISYCSLMDEINRRTDVIHLLRNGKVSLLHTAVEIDTMCLQIRKILELISLGSLVSNKEEFSKQCDKFSKYWHAEKILNDIAVINPDFYPQPVKADNLENGFTNLENIENGYLTKDEFIKVYEKCGKIAHAENPYGSKIDYSYYDRNIGDWINKIDILLSLHIVKLVDKNCFYLIHMKEKNNRSHGFLYNKI